MAELRLTDDEALALGGTTDSRAGFLYPTVGEAEYGAKLLRLFAKLAANAVTDLQVYAVASNADAVGVRAGRCTLAGTIYSYAGEDPALDGLTDDDTTYVWAEDDGAGSLQIDSALDGTGWPATAHIKLAEVTMASGVITGIVDRRFEVVVQGFAGGTQLSAATASLRGGVNQAAAEADVTDSSGGSADGTLAAVSGSGADSDINNNFADLAATLNGLMAKLRTAGVLAS